MNAKRYNLSFKFRVTNGATINFGRLSPLAPKHCANSSNNIITCLIRDEAEDRIIDDLVASKADIGISGLYMTNVRYSLVDFAPVIMQDCGTFMSLGSYALSK